MTNLAATLTAIVSERALPHVEELIELFGSLRRPLLRYVCTFGIGGGEAEEIVQDSFLALFKHLESGKSRQNLQPWVFRVCHNLALKQREKTRWLETVDWLSSYADTVPDPEQQVIQAQRRKKLQAVLRALTEQDRCCLCLRAEGLRYREIAEILGMSLGGVSLSLSRSLAKFERADQG